MKKTVVSVLVLLFVFALGFFSVDHTEASPICITKKVEVASCCEAVGYIWARYCCVLPDGSYLECEWRLIRDNQLCPPGAPLC